MKTPASAKWLTWEYARFKGAIKRRERKLVRLEKLVEFHERFAVKYRHAFCAERASLDVDAAHFHKLEAILHLHVAGLDPAEVAAVRPQKRPCLMGHGGITKTVYRAISESTNREVMTSDVVQRIMDSAALRDPDYKRVRERVQVRLAILAKTGRLLALSPNGLANRRWALPPKQTGVGKCSRR